MFFYLVIFALFCAYFLVQKRYSYWDKLGFFTVKPSFPFGNISGVGFKINVAEGYDKIYKENKGKAPVLGFFTFLSPSLMPIDPELVKNILIRDFSSFHDRGKYYNKKDDPLSANILSVDGAEWKKLRTKLSPTFSSGKMKMMFDIVNEISDRLAKVLGDKVKATGSIEMKEYTAKYTNDVIGNVAFGIEPNCLVNDDSDFRKYGKMVIDFSPLKVLFTNGAPELSRKLGITAFDPRATKYFMEIFKETFALRDKQGTNIKRHDFLELLLQMKQVGDNDGLTVEELAANAFLFYAGGFETSSTTITFSLYELALNPEIQKRLRLEIQEHIGTEGLTYDKLYELKYLDNFVSEVLRKYPPIPLSIRVCIKDYKIPNSELVIPKGTLLNFPIYSFHHDDEYFPNPSKFDPDRFNDENKLKINPNTFLAFGDGPRNCIGQRFGLMQVKIGLVKLIQNYEFTPSDKTTIPMKFTPSSIFLSPINGMWLTVKKIN